MNKTTKDNSYDVVVVGAGHNGLVAAAYLAQAGLSVLVLERRNQAGGATANHAPFPDYDVQVSSYSYLVSMLPQEIVNDLRLAFTTKQRSVASYTPNYDDPSKPGLFISNVDEGLSRESFTKLTGNEHEYRRYLHFLEMEGELAKAIWPTLLEPLRSKQELKKSLSTDLGQQAWEGFIEQPLGEVIETNLKNDAVRGLLFTDAKIGVLTHPDDQSLLQNKTFLYHIIGNGTGEWRVPVGGMGRLVSQLVVRAQESGAQIVTGAGVTSIENANKTIETHYMIDGKDFSVRSRFLLANIAPQVLATIMTSYKYQQPSIEGSVFKLNILLSRLPRLRDRSCSSKQAFTGTFHVDEGYETMKAGFNQAHRNEIPDIPTGEMYCHSLTDDSLLAPDLRSKGYQTLSLFGLDMPHRLFENDNNRVKSEVLKKYLKRINQYLAEPIEDCIAKDKQGGLCVEAKSPVDLEDQLNLPLGNIFHNGLSWPFAQTKDEAGTWGVETNIENVYVCGSGASRGGCVSGIPGHNAAMKVLQEVNGRSNN